MGPSAPSTTSSPGRTSTRRSRECTRTCTRRTRRCCAALPSFAAPSKSSPTPSCPLHATRQWSLPGTLLRRFRAELSPSACGLGAPRVPTIRLFAFRAHMHCLLSVDRLVEERVLAALLSVEFLSCVSVWCYGPVGRCLYSVSYFVHKDL